MRRPSPVAGRWPAGPRLYVGHAVAYSRARAGWRSGLSRALWADGENSVSYFPENRNAYFFVMNPTSINHSKLHGCPKIVKLSLLGSRKCHLSVSVVSSQLAIMMIGS